ncbi:MAG: hypothetical protein KIT09_33900 [Bryobacteraceae bacterium]|nr:hypothetical protein [Bryobacteraceae bacterium]
MLGAVCTASGAALVAYVLTGISLSLTLLAALVGAAAVAPRVWRRMSTAQRSLTARRTRAGLLAGLAATAAYDLFRLALVLVAGFRFWPFDIFEIFGKALVGEGAPRSIVIVAGVSYHVLNGVGFAAAFAVWFGDRGVAAGILWALVLEAFMVAIYPGWLSIKALDEFLPVSAFGHVAYGATLGWTTKRLLQ